MAPALGGSGLHKGIFEAFSPRTGQCNPDQMTDAPSPLKSLETGAAKVPSR